MSFGTLPRASGGPSIDVAVRYRPFLVGLEARIDLPITVKIPEGGSFTSWMAMGTLSPCSQVRYVFGCALISLGAIKSTGSGTHLMDESPMVVAMAGPRAGVELPISDRFSALLYGDISARLTRNDIVAYRDVVWLPPTFAGLIGVRLAFKVAPLRKEPERRSTAAYVTGAQH